MGLLKGSENAELFCIFHLRSNSEDCEKQHSSTSKVKCPLLVRDPVRAEHWGLGCEPASPWARAGWSPLNLGAAPCVPGTHKAQTLTSQPKCDGTKPEARASLGTLWSIDPHSPAAQLPA